MKKRFTEAQIVGFLREVDAGIPVKDLCRKHGFSEAGCYLWRSVTSDRLGAGDAGSTSSGRSATRHRPTQPPAPHGGSITTIELCVHRTAPLSCKRKAANGSWRLDAVASLV